jgi:hypothetical protein
VNFRSSNSRLGGNQPHGHWAGSMSRQTGRCGMNTRESRPGSRRGSSLARRHRALPVLGTPEGWVRG